MLDTFPNQLTQFTKHLNLLDTAFFVNSSYAPLLRPERKVDLIIHLNYCAGSQTKASKAGRAPAPAAPEPSQSQRLYHGDLHRCEMGEDARLAHSEAASEELPSCSAMQGQRTKPCWQPAGSPVLGLGVCLNSVNGNLIFAFKHLMHLAIFQLKKYLDEFVISCFQNNPRVHVITGLPYG